jgi:hypothetical protein
MRVVLAQLIKDLVGAPLRVKAEITGLVVVVAREHWVVTLVLRAVLVVQEFHHQ